MNYWHQALRRATNLLSAEEIALMLAVDATWELPKASPGRLVRMAEAREMLRTEFRRESKPLGRWWASVSPVVMKRQPTARAA